MDKENGKNMEAKKSISKNGEDRAVGTNGGKPSECTVSESSKVRLTALSEPLGLPASASTPAQNNQQNVKSKRAKNRKNKPAAKIPNEAKPSSNLERELREMKMEILALKKEAPRTKNVLILNGEEPYIKEAKARRDIDRRRVIDILRMVGMPGSTGIKRVHRVGKWRPPNPTGALAPARPLLVEFISGAARDVLLARAILIEKASHGRYKVIPDLNRRYEIGNQEIGGMVKKGDCVSNPGKERYKKMIDKNPIPGVVVIEDALEDETWQSCIYEVTAKGEHSQADKRDPRGANETWATVAAHNITPLRTAQTNNSTHSKNKVKDVVAVTNVKEYETFHSLTLARNGVTWMVPDTSNGARQSPKNGTAPRVLRPRGLK